MRHNRTFTWEVRDGRLYGRGSCDMKGGVAASLRVLEVMAAHRNEWSGELVVALAGAFLAVPAGELQNEPKVVLAYSTISHLGLIVLLVGLQMGLGLFVEPSDVFLFAPGVSD